MQNFSETFLKPVGGAIVVPAGDGAEAFVDADDIAAAATATLADPQAHAGAQYALTGPEALTVAEAAKDHRRRSAARLLRHADNRSRRVGRRRRSRRGASRVRGRLLRMLTENHRVRSGLTAYRRRGEKRPAGPPARFADFARRTAAAWAGDEAR